MSSLRSHDRTDRYHMCARAPGFSLVEVLVVVGVIALLIAILVPSLGQAREQAQLTSCRSNLRQIATAMATYAGPRDTLVPGDYGMGHDIWNHPDEGVDAGTPSRPVNLGHLLQVRALPMPRSEEHAFYCPALSLTGGRWSFTYRNSGPFAKVAPRGFGGWGIPGRSVNIGYEYRDTADGEPDGLWLPLGHHLGEVARHALLSDVFSWGTAQWGHRTRYNFARGDGSVGTYQDPGKPAWLYQRLVSTSGHDDALMFQVFEHPSRIRLLFP